MGVIRETGYSGQWGEVSRVRTNCASFIRDRMLQGGLSVQKGTCKQVVRKEGVE